MKKTVIVRGSPASLQLAITEIILQLADSQHRALGRALYVPRGVPDIMPSSSAMNLNNNNNNNANNANNANRAVNLVTDANVPLQTVMVGVPDQMMGGVIGKHGSVIREIRARSSATITIGERSPTTTPDATPADRIITITGSPSATQIAIAMICERTTQFQQQHQMQNTQTQTLSLANAQQQPNFNLKNKH